MSIKQFGRDLRDHLMTGVSYMIPFVVAGGILIAVAFLAGGIDAEGQIPQLLLQLGQAAFGLLPLVLGGYIAYSIADRPGLAPGFVAGFIANEQGSGFIGGIVAGLAAGYIVLGLKKIPVPAFLRSLMPVLFLPLFGTAIAGLFMQLVLGPPATWLNEAATAALNGLGTESLIVLGLVQGAMLASDMGGPINKAAYFFALAAGTSAGNWDPMAANFVASMAPPLGIAIAILIAKNKFTPVERKGVTGCFVGAGTMITEFAIPYAAADPFRVIPSLMVGSSVGAASSYLFGLSLQAPHGGLLVLPLASSPLLFLLSLAIASVVTAAMLLILKPSQQAPEEQPEARTETTASTDGSREVTA